MAALCAGLALLGNRSAVKEWASGASPTDRVALVTQRRLLR